MNPREISCKMMMISRAPHLNQTPTSVPRCVCSNFARAPIIARQFGSPRLAGMAGMPRLLPVLVVAHLPSSLPRFSSSSHRNNTSNPPGSQHSRRASYVDPDVRPRHSTWSQPSASISLLGIHQTPPAHILSHHARANPAIFPDNHHLHITSPQHIARLGFRCAPTPLPRRSLRGYPYHPPAELCFNKTSHQNITIHPRR